MALQSPSDEELDATPGIFHALQTDESSMQALQPASEQLSSGIAAEEDREDIEQRTLAEILRAVHKCMASVKTLQEHVGLREEVGLIRHDIQKK